MTEPVFTREDVERLRCVQFDSVWGAWNDDGEKKFGVSLDAAYVWAEDLANRIEATLPPEDTR